MDNISSAFTKLHMPGMASCWRTLNETHQTDRLSFSDGLELLLQSELDSRRNNRIARLIRSANFKQHACIEELEASDARGIPAGAVKYRPEQSISWPPENISRQEPPS